MPAIKLDWTVNVSTLTGGLVFLFSAGMAWSGVNSRLSDLEKRAEKAVVIESIVQTLSTNDTVSRRQLDAIEAALRETRSVNNEILTRLGTIREDVASLKARVRD